MPGGEVQDLAALATRLATDPQALAETYRLLAPTVLGYLRRLLPPADAEDALQSTFADVWRNRHRFQADRSLTAWVIGIARLRALDVLRSRQEATSLEEAPEPVRDEDLAERFVRSQQVRQALLGVPAEQRQVLVLAYFNDLTQSQIADWLDIPLGTVKARSSRGLRTLAAILRTAEAQTPKGQVR